MLSQLSNAAACALRCLLGCALFMACAKEQAGPELRVRCRSGSQPVELVLERALPIDAAGELEPSGLLLHRGSLLVVDDKRSDAVLRLELGSSAARASPFLRVSSATENLDWEGLTLDRDGTFLVASENASALTRISPSGALTRLGESLLDVGKEKGLFATPGGGLEGVTALPNGGVLAAVERQPRGLIELSATDGRGTASAWAMPEARCPSPLGRPNDFADLTTDAGRVYALQRNASLIVRLERTPDGWRELEAWSYGATENDARFRYEDREFGLAEGLALSVDHVYVVLDNNRQRRAANAHDRRPQLFIFRRP